MPGEDGAQRRYAGGVRGFYVVNPRTGIPVAGPYRDESAAEYEATRRNATRPVAPDQLIVRRVRAGAQ